MLIVFGGLPGVGKTTIARELARQIGAVHVRIDSIEFAFRQSRALQGPVEDAGYCAAYAVAEDNLRLGLPVVADSVNPLPITREAWRDVARRAGSALAEIEIVCSDGAEHRRRVETRSSDFPGWTLTWQEVVDRDYRPWDGDPLIIDTARTSPADSVLAIRHRLGMPR
jgi:predicted kinase